MSLVNQVLNDLEKRGINVTQADASIRAVPPRKPSRRMPYVVGVFSLLILAGAAKWYLGQEEAVAVEPVLAAANAEKYALVAGLSDVAAQTASMAVPASAVADAATAPMPVVPTISSQPAVAENAVPAPQIKKTRVAKKTNPADGAASIKRGAATEATAERNPYKKISPRQHAENEFNKANQAAQQGRAQDAIKIGRARV